MNLQTKKKKIKQIALILSLGLIFVWALLGTGASLAWFNDTSNELKNIFQIADFDLDVSYRLPDGSWQPMDGSSEVFDKDALYEPGYVQVVYLKIENKGDRAFDFKTAVSVTDYTQATNYYGQEFCIQDYLKFGVAFADTEAEMDALVGDRQLAQAIATEKLSNYASDTDSLAPDTATYMALVVQMPEEVDNEANYRGDVIPKVELGIVVNASQQKQ